MGVFKRPDSPYYWLLLDGHKDARGNPLREPTKIRHDAPLHTQRNENKKLAEQHYHARMTALAKGEITKPTITFGAHLDWWMTHKLPARRGKSREAGIIPRFRAAFGDVDLTAIDRHRVQEWITARLATPTVVTQGKHQRSVLAKPSTVNREVNVLKSILQAAVPKYLETSPLYGMPTLRVPTPKRRIVEEDEEARLLAVMTPADKAMYLVGVDGLLRLGDILDLKWADVYEDSAWIADPKTGTGFSLPLSKRTQAAIAAIKPKKADPKAFVFAHRRIAENPEDWRGAVRLAMQRYCKRAKVPYGRNRGGIVFHWATRRTGLTRMLTRQVDIGTAQKVGRWKTASIVLDAYHELIDEKARAAVEAIGPRDSGVNGRRKKGEKTSIPRAKVKRQTAR